MRIKNNNTMIFTPLEWEKLSQGASLYLWFKGNRNEAISLNKVTDYKLLKKPLDSTGEMHKDGMYRLSIQIDEPNANFMERWKFNFTTLKQFMLATGNSLFMDKTEINLSA